MIVLKNNEQLLAMKKACQISARALKIGGEAVVPGITTKEIDKIINNFIISQNAKPSFLGYNGFPASACISINNCVIHGIPDKTIIREGDIVSIDVGAYYEGFHGDNAATFAAGKVSDDAQKLMDATRESLYKAIEMCKPGNRVGDIGYAVQSYVEERGYAVVKDFIGHGVGAKLHEDPEVPNYGRAGRGARLVPGMTLAIEPMINAKGEGVKIMPDGWTVLTESGSLSAHFEHTVAITDSGVMILTEI